MSQQHSQTLLPLEGLRVLVTRAKAQQSDLFEIIRAQGAHPISFPTLELLPPSQDEQQALKGLFRAAHKKSFDITLFTSSNTLLFLEAINDKGMLSPELWPSEIYALGQKSAQGLRQRGFRVKTPPLATAEALFQTLLEDAKTLEGKHICLPQASAARPWLRAKLKEYGARVSAPTLYITSPCRNKAIAPDSDWVTFASPSALQGYVLRCDKAQDRKVAVIGPTTAKEARKLGFEIHAMPKEPSLKSMIEAMAEFEKLKIDGKL
jgi:uroporphyrinogen III methyltransferase / synthase